MNRRKIHISWLVAVLLLALLGMAEEKSPPAEIPFKLTVVLNEYDGNTKVSSLPYIMPCKATSRLIQEASVLRMGFEVPYLSKENEVQYRSVGTNLDCRSTPPDERGGFMVDLGIEHNVVYSHTGANGELRPGTPQANAAAPVTGGIHANLRTLLLHDGQTVNALTATDPVNGHVWKVEVTLNVVK
ncbi:MAG TPA: hypothetical protein VG206_25825 [Terriglobia bacterium]|nr:hypothetical protein [Terriglobia bacterium]